MKTRNIHFIQLVFVLFLVAMAAGCSNQVPKNEPLDIVFNTFSPGTIRGVDRVHIRPDRSVELTDKGVHRRGILPEAQYNRLVSSIRRMNFKNAFNCMLGSDDGSAGEFTLEVRSIDKPKRFTWIGSRNDTFQPVLMEFQAIRRGIQPE